MIYIFSLLVCFVCLIYYDILNKKGNRKIAYYGLLVWFIAISGLQYKMGTDIVYYMDWYKTLDPRYFSFNDLISNNMHYQPGWMAVGYLCRAISDDFVLLKMVQAIFTNIAVFSFFKRESRYVFICIFLYAYMSYLVVNLNVVRQAFAIGFALYGFTALRLRQYKKYYLFALLAYLFHNSAILLIPIPLINLINRSGKSKFTRKRMVILLCAFVAFLGILSLSNVESYLSGLMDSGLFGDKISTIGTAYLGADRLGVQSTFGIFSIQRLIMIVAVVYYMKKYNNLFYGSLGLIYILLHIMTEMLPILWRFRLYFDFPYYIVLAQLIVGFAKSRQRFSKLWLSVMIFLVLFFPFRDYMAPVDKSKYRNIDQYYPYHSIFDMEHDEQKDNFFRQLSL